MPTAVLELPPVIGSTSTYGFDAFGHTDGLGERHDAGSCAEASAGNITRSRTRARMCRDFSRPLSLEAGKVQGRPSVRSSCARAADRSNSARTFCPAAFVSASWASPELDDVADAGLVAAFGEAQAVAGGEQRFLGGDEALGGALDGELGLLELEPHLLAQRIDLCGERAEVASASWTRAQSPMPPKMFQFMLSPTTLTLPRKVVSAPPPLTPLKIDSDGP